MKCGRGMSLSSPQVPSPKCAFAILVTNPRLWSLYRAGKQELSKALGQATVVAMGARTDGMSDDGVDRILSMRQDPSGEEEYYVKLKGRHGQHLLLSSPDSVKGLSWRRGFTCGDPHPKVVA